MYFNIPSSLGTLNVFSGLLGYINTMHGRMDGWTYITYYTVFTSLFLKTNRKYHFLLVMLNLGHFLN